MNIEEYIVEQLCNNMINNQDINPDLISGDGRDRVTYTPPKFISTSKGLVLIGSHIENTK